MRVVRPAAVAVRALIDKLGNGVLWLVEWYFKGAIILLVVAAPFALLSHCADVLGPYRDNGNPDPDCRLVERGYIEAC